MAEVTVKQLADTVGTPVEKLLEQLKDAGVDKTTPDDTIADAEKSQLLTFLRQSHGVEKKASGASKITLTRKKRGEIKVGGPGRKAVTVETRGKRTYAKRDESAREEMVRQAALRQQQVSEHAQPPTPEPAAPPPPAEPAPVATLAPPAESAIDTEREALEAKEKALEAKAAELEAKAAALEAAQQAAAEQAKADAERAIFEAANAVATEEPAAEPQAEAPVEVAEDNAADDAAAEAAAEAERQQQAEQEAREEAEREAALAAARKAVEEAALAELQQGVEDAGRAKLEAVRKAAEAELARVEEEKRQAAKVKREKFFSTPAAPPADSGKGGRRGRGKSGRKELRVSGGRGGRRERQAPRREFSRSAEAKHGFAMPTEPVVRDVEVPETITVAELANRMAVKAGEVIKTMMGMGVMATINQMLDQDTAVLVVEEMGHRASTTSADDLEAELENKIIGSSTEADAADTDLDERPPVVTVMGHVDHGKTSLLDYIRSSRVAAGEAGGITQHIGAYSVDHDRGRITFLDTPGHAAFTAMRARGAQATDIVVLVVAADDGAMPQTVEAVQHSKAAGVPMIVAVNKMDKEDADPDRVKNDLSKHEVIPEDWGGDTMFVPVSALTGQGIDDLLDALLLQAELLELKATADGPAKGVVVEATLEKGRGPVATVLVQSGTLKRGDIMVCGKEFGRVRAMFDDAGNQVETAGPSVPVQVLGLGNAPEAGQNMLVSKDERSARELAGLRNEKSRDARLAERRPAKLEDVFSQVTRGDISTLNLVIKTDVQGSFEALRDSLEKLSTDEVVIKVIGGGVGGITESDAQLAAASGAIMIGFNVRADNTARRVITEQEIELHYDSVIYEVIDRVKAAAGGMLAPEIREQIIGMAKVQDVFRSPKFGAIAGCMVEDGVVRKSAPIRVLRENVVIYEGELESLRRFKDDVNEVRMGTECGIGVKNYTDVQPGDQIEVFERTEVARTL